MGILDKLQGDGGYVFVSHSHLDIKKVRTIRNLLEEKGFEPILFYLKSLDDSGQDKTEFLRSLIYDEIDAREFFLYLDSENARKSDWVRQELEYIEKYAPHKLTTVDLEENDDSIKKKIEALASRMRIFISYSMQDKEIAQKIKKALVNSDFRVYDTLDIPPGIEWELNTANMINEASKEGIIMFIVSEKSTKSQIILNELEYALKIHARILPIFIDKCYLDAKQNPILFALRNYQGFFFENTQCDEEIKNLVKILRNI